MKPTKTKYYAQMYTETIRKNYHTTACFHDVASAYSPFKKVDYDITIKDAGKFRSTIENYCRLFKYLGNIHGIVIGEGLGFCFYSGHIDGVHSSIYNRGDEEKLPLFIDYQLRKNHPLEVW